MFSFSLFQPLDVTSNISLFQKKWISFFICHLVFFYVKMWDLLRKRKVKITYLIQLCTTSIMPYRCVIHTAWCGTNHSLIPHNHVSYAVSSPVRQYASSISYATASHTKWMITWPVWWDVKIYGNFVNAVLLFYSQFSSNKLSVICGRRFSFITVASIDFLSDLQLIFWNFNACILPSIIRHTVVYAVWYGVWFLMVWPWFGHSSLNHNEHAVWHAVSRMKMPPVREYASSLLSCLCCLQSLNLMDGSFFFKNKELWKKVGDFP